MTRIAKLVGVVLAFVSGMVWAGEGVEMAREGGEWARGSTEWAGEAREWAGDGRKWTGEGGEWAVSWGEEEVYSPGAAMFEGLMELGRQSTVYSFSLGNLFIILGLKLLVLLVLGGGLGVGVGRSLGAVEAPWVDGTDALFLTTYLVSENEDSYDCLNRLACLDHYRAHDLLTAARMMIKAAKYLKPYFGFSLNKYERVSWSVEDAVHYKYGGGSCHTRYPCHTMPSL